MVNDFGLIGVALLGALAGCVLGLLPGLHIYNIAGLAFVLMAGGLISVADEPLALFLLGALVGWSVVNVVPSVFLFAPDDANALVVLPTTKYFMRGRGVEAAMFVGAGSLCALIGLVLLSPLLDEVLRPLRAIIQPHLGWMLCAVVAFMLLGEWPRANDLAPTRLRRWLSAWAYLGAGLLTFTLSGLLGFVLMFRSPVPVSAAFQNLMPAFVGLFAIPGLLQLLFFSSRPPLQDSAVQGDVPVTLLARGALTGLGGGLFAGVLPVVTGGIGGLLAGHATALRDDRLFMISQGASKIGYYVGSLLLLFVPGLTLARGGMAWMLTSTYVPQGWHSYWLAVAAVALCGAFAFAFLIVAARGAARLVNAINIKWIAVIALSIASGLTWFFTAWGGIVVMLIATTIGLIPVLVGGRRMNCLGVLLMPITLNVIGVGPQVAQWLGLL
jgi:putative membrane protein